MKVLKKIGTVLLASVLTLGMVACGSTTQDDKPVVRDPSDTSDYSPGL